MKKILRLLFIAFLLIPFYGSAQNTLKNTWTVPATYNVGDKVDWYFEFNLPVVTSDFADGEDLYLWAWEPSEPSQGAWDNSLESSKLTNVGNMVWKMEMDPTLYFNMSLQDLNAKTEKSYWFLLKNGAGTKQTGSIGVPFNVNVLPLTFTNFSVNKSDNGVNLTWLTANEVNNSHFNILHSIDGFAWTIIGKIQGKNLANNTYTFQHSSPVASNNYYKLQQVDGDGKFTYSDIKAVDFSLTAQLVKVFPNPVSEVLNVYLPHQLIGSNYLVYNTLGVKVKEGQINSINQKIDFTTIKNGFYYLRIDGKSPIKFVKK